MTPETRMLVEVLLAVSTGAIALLIRIMVRRIESVTTDVRDSVRLVAAEVKEIGQQVSAHAASLSAGTERFRGIERRLDEVERRLNHVIREGAR